MDKKIFRLLIAALILSLIGGGYLGYQDYRLKQRGFFLETELTKRTSELVKRTGELASTTESLNLLQEDFVKMKAERDDFEQKYYDEKSRLDFIAAQVGDLTNMVGVMEKLNQMDPELLKKYSKVYFLNENYAPEKLLKIDDKYVYNNFQRELFVLQKIWLYLQNLMEDAASAGVDIKILSAYRSFDEQAELKYSYATVYGSGANQFSADQGYSEHQLGTAMDFTTQKIGAALPSFEASGTYKWLIENAHKYGFAISYPKSNEYFRFEPWHWRFIGRSLADKLHAENKYFYDLDQRLIDTYLLSFFD